MAVYTEVSDEALAAFLADYDIGGLVAFRGIAEGVENSNFSLRTTTGDFILTLYEKRVDPAELPWFLGLMEHLAQRGITCPLPVQARDGAALRQLCGRHAAITTFLPGVWPRRVRQEHCAPAGRRRWPPCTWPAPTMRPPGATRSAPPAGAALLARGAGARRRGAARVWPPSCTRRWRRSWPPGRPACRAGTSMPTCSPTTSSSSTAACPA